MLMLAVLRLVSSAARMMMPWLLNLATCVLARSLNMPEPLVHDTGILLFTHVQTIESSVGETLCPIRLLHQLRSLLKTLSRTLFIAGAARRRADPQPSTPQLEERTIMIQPSLFLRRALLADAIFSGVSALGLTLGAGAFASLFNLPEALLRETGLFLIAYTALVGWLGTRQTVPRGLVLIVVAGNAAWTLASIALLFSGAVNPNLAGKIVVVAQAVATGVFAELQYIGLRKSGDAVAV